jgi:hypothetical protein
MDETAAPAGQVALVTGASSGLPPERRLAIWRALLAAEGPRGEFAAGWVRGMALRNGAAWSQEIVTDWSAWTAEAQAAFLLTLPVERATWELARSASRDAQRRYWDRVHPWGAHDGSAAIFARELLSHGRPWAAIEALSGLLHGAGRSDAEPPSELIESARRDALRSEGRNAFRLDRL